MRTIHTTTEVSTNNIHHSPVYLIEHKAFESNRTPIVRLSRAIAINKKYRTHKNWPSNTIERSITYGIQYAFDFFRLVRLFRSRNQNKLEVQFCSITKRNRTPIVRLSSIGFWFLMVYCTIPWDHSRQR